MVLRFNQTVSFDQTALDTELHSRDGAVARVLAGVGSTVTAAINDQYRARAGGAWWPTSTSVESGPVAPTLRVNVSATQPHVIVPRSAGGVLVFEASSGDIVFTRRVNHPGSSPPQHLVEAGIIDATSRSAFFA